MSDGGIRIEIGDAVRAIVATATKPYEVLLSRLRAEGRVTEEELATWREDAGATDGALTEAVAVRMATMDLVVLDDEPEE